MTVEDVEELVISFGTAVAAIPVAERVGDRDEVGEAAAARWRRDRDSERALHAAGWIEVGAGLDVLRGFLRAVMRSVLGGAGVRFVAAFRGADRRLAER